MPGFADAEQLQVNAAEPLDGGFVAAAFLVQVAREAIGQVGVPRINVHVAEQVVIHVVPIRVRVGREQADILVEVERAAEREVELLGLMDADEVAIDAFHRLAGRQAENEIRVGAQLAGDDASNQGRSGLLVRLYDYFHRPNPPMMGRKKTSRKTGSKGRAQPVSRLHGCRGCGNTNPNSLRPRSAGLRPGALVT